MAVTDLTNTKWLFNDDVTLSDFGVVNANATFNINFTMSETFSEYIGFEVRYKAEQINGIRYVNDINEWAYQEGSWLDNSFKTIEITGGTDVTNADLIAGITANATQITSGGSMYLGTSTISKMYLGNAEVSKVYLGQDLVYEKQASLLEFTARQSVVSYGPYQFEQGMTFAQWVASAYNTDGWVATEYAIVLNGFYFIKPNTSLVVRPTDLVEAIQYYLETDN